MNIMNTTARQRLALGPIALAPFLAGLVMLDPDRAIVLGLTSLTILSVPLALRILPGTAAPIWPRGRLAQLGMLVFAVAVMLAGLRAPHPGFSMLALSFWAMAGFAALYIHTAMIRGEGGSGLARAVLVAVLIAGPLHALTLPLMELVYGAERDIVWFRSFPGFNHARKAGHLYTMSAAAGLGLVLWPQGDGGSRQVMIWVLACLALALVLWTGARGAWGALLVGGVLAIVARGVPPRHWWRLSGLCLAAICVALLIPSPHGNLGFWQEIGSSIQRSGSVETLSSGRISMWRAAVELIVAQPWAGQGWGQFIFLDKRSVPQVHNFPLDLMLGLGVPAGGLALLLLLIVWLRAQGATGAEGRTGLIVLNTMAIYSLVSGGYYYGVPVVLTGLIWGLCLASRPQSGSI